LVKQAGFPRKIVEEAVVEEARLGFALDALGRRLCGWEAGEYVPDLLEAERDERDAARQEELVALEAVLGERFAHVSETEYSASIEHGRDTIELRIVFDDSPYPSLSHPVPPAFYIASDTVPSYMRLHLHRTMLEQFRAEDRHDLRGIIEGGQGGAVLVMLEHLEGALAETIESPPDVGRVTEHLAPKVEEAEVAPAVRRERRAARRGGPVKRRLPTQANHEAELRRQELLFRRKDYEEMMRTRQALPAWNERENIVNALESNRVLVVVGEVST
jgi:HrpA-like RNA helicase